MRRGRMVNWWTDVVDPELLSTNKEAVEGGENGDRGACCGCDCVILVSTWLKSKEGRVH
jgi:hypothetical protein